MRALRLVAASRAASPARRCALACALALAAAPSATGCGRFFFFPDRVLRVRPDQIGLEYRDVFFRSSDGVRIHGWLLPARADAGEPAGTVVFLHGNAQNVSSHIGSVLWMPAAGFHVFLVDYRGYGTSEGEPDIEGVHRDAEAAIRRATTLPGVDPERIAVFGQSLGGAIATSAVAHARRDVAVRALVLDSAFSDFRGIAREKLGSLWLTWLLQVPLAATVSDELQPLEALRSLHDIPVLVVHGDADDIIPLDHAVRLHEAAGPAAQLWLVPGAGHIQAFEHPEMRARLTEFLRAAFALPARAPASAPAPSAATLTPPA
jgi:pimeloyl-ACP methyl ester carboxylesterase